MKDNRHVCINCQHFLPYLGITECWSHDSDYMYKPRFPDDSCPAFEPKGDAQDKQPKDCMGCWYYKTAEVCQNCCRNYRDQYTPKE